MAFGLAIRAPPVQKNTQRYDENDVRNDDRGPNRGIHGVVLVHLNYKPRIDATVVARESLAVFELGFVVGSKFGAGYFRRISTSFDIDQ